VRTLRLGTRGSALALVQAELVRDALAAQGVESTIVPVVTTGDRRRAAPDKEKWVKELELALLADEIDLAVHSAQDVPGALPDGLGLAGALPRADPRDALCGAASLDALQEGARVGTSSLRRRSQLLAARPDLVVTDVRGNVDTRLKALAAGEVDALVLAAAGLERLGRQGEIGAMLDAVPAPGQGVVTLEARAGDATAREGAGLVTDAAAWTALRCERALVIGLGATCNTPVGAFAVPDGTELVVRAFAGLPDGSEWVSDELRGATAEPEALGAVVAARLLAAGGRDLLRRAEAGEEQAPRGGRGPAG
jgi:hydroxymethylbilane synthase